MQRARSRASFVLSDMGNFVRQDPENGRLKLVSIVDKRTDVLIPKWKWSKGNRGPKCTEMGTGSDISRPWGARCSGGNLRAAKNQPNRRLYGPVAATDLADHAANDSCDVSHVHIIEPQIFVDHWICRRASPLFQL
ncbi:hypothetical protein [Brevundimonas nasdae]|uniref:hypothetical protein n=1 Tax=Brevundimonas nasdae TaxID=172043 RepID=UPI0012EEB5C3|nr:hypothetical protein [Brevundimonas nasdae]